MGVFDAISNALSSNSPQGGTMNKKVYDKRSFDTSARDAIRDKLKALGLDAMPEGGQAQLDEMWGDYLKRRK